MKIIAISDASAPCVRSSRDMPGTVMGVDISGQLAFIPNGDHGLQIVDITDPDNPLLFGGVDTPGIATDVIVESDRAVMASSDSLQVIDIADPAHPMLISSLELPAPALRLARHGSIVYAACGWDGIAVINLADDTRPSLIALAPAKDKAVLDVAASSDGEHIYVSRYDRLCSCILSPCDAHLTTGDLATFPAQCPPGVSPVEVTRLEALAQRSSIVVRWQIAQPDEWSDFRLHRSKTADGTFTDLKTPWTREAEGRYASHDNSAEAGVTYFYRLEARDRTGHPTFYGPVSATVSFSAPTFLGHSRPNPFTEDHPAAIRFSLPSAGSIRMRIVDVNGRAVRDLVDGHLEKGDHETVWDGRDARGQVAPAGIYYWELSGRGESLSHSLVKLR